MTKKMCKACGGVFELSESFYKHPLTKDGYTGKCIKCIKNRMAITDRNSRRKHKKEKGRVTPEYIEMMKSKIRAEKIQNL